MIIIVDIIGHGLCHLFYHLIVDKIIIIFIIGSIWEIILESYILWIVFLGPIRNFGYIKIKLEKNMEINRRSYMGNNENKKK